MKHLSRRQNMTVSIRRHSRAGGVLGAAGVLACVAAACHAAAAPVELDCRYTQVADPSGLRVADEVLALRFSIDRDANRATVRSGDFQAEVELRFSQRHVTLLQGTGSDSLFVTAIVFDALDDSDLYRSVHSRHAMIGSLGELWPSQYYGRCAPVYEGEDADG